MPDVLIGDDLTKPINRSEFTALLVQGYDIMYRNILGGGGGWQTPFTDIENDESEDAIKKAYERGFIKGMTETTFEPNSYVTREQMTTMFLRTCIWAPYKDYAPDMDKVTLFADDDKISDWAREDVYFASYNKVVKGIDENHFAPKPSNQYEEEIGYGYATKEQAISLYLHMLKRYGIWNIGTDIIYE